MKKNEIINTSEWITQTELATRLNVSLTRVSNWLRRGKIEYKQLPGGKIRLVNPKTLKINL